MKNTKLIMRQFILTFLIFNIALAYERLIIASDNISAISIVSHPGQATTVRSSQYTYENDTNKFPFSKPNMIWGPSNSVNNWVSRTFQHLFFLKCSASITLYCIADDLFQAYLNGVKVMFTPYNQNNKGDDWYKMVFSRTIYFKQNIYLPGQTNNFTIKGTNYKSNQPTSASIAYQLTQSSTQNCIRLIAQSQDDPSSITIINDPSEIFSVADGFDFGNDIVNDGLKKIRGTNTDVPNNFTLAFQHLFSMNCNAPLTLRVRADDLFIAYLNGQRILETPCFDDNGNYIFDNYHTFTYSITITPEQSIFVPCGTNNFTIQATNYYPTSTSDHPYFVIYQLTQVDEDQCILEKCSLPLKWFGYPACECSCPYSQQCGPGFTFNKKRSSYKHSHIKN